ncbi:MAG: DUF2865 domain-containing protein [Methyloceanibacter sp.]
MNARHELRPASFARRVRRHPRFALLALCGIGIAGLAGMALAQDSDQQIRCMQLQQELASAQGGGGRDALPGIEKQIQDANRVFQGTQAAMEDAGCYESFFIFGRGLVRSPKCLSMNDRVEAARRQVDQLQDQRGAILGGGGDRRRQADLQDALARNGCGRQYQQPVRREGGGGLFGWFRGGGREEEQPAQPEAPVYRSIDPNGRYRSVCVRTCDGFFFPISYSTYASRLAQDATACQANCAAPAELYVYRNPGQEIDQAISLNGAAYKDLPAAFKYRKAYVKGCSCKEAEYNPTEIEAGQQKAEAAAAAGKPGAKKKPAAPAAQAAAPAPPSGGEPPAQLDAPAQQAATPAPPAPAAALAQPAPQAAVPAQQSNITKSKTPPAPQ